MWENRLGEVWDIALFSLYNLFYVSPRPELSELHLLL